MTSARPPSVRTDGSNAFARHSIAVRVPGIIDDTIDRNPDYAPSIQAALAALRDAIQGDAPLALFDPPAPDYDLWTEAFAPYEGETWLNTEWFFSEALAYRLMMQAARFWDTGRDPFAPFKHDEWASDALWDSLEAVEAVEGTLEEQLAARLVLTLWGNRIDLSLKHVAEQGTAARDEHVLANDSLPAVEHVLAHPGEVHVVMDNAGTEQALDYGLTDFLLAAGVATRVTLHVKMHPVLVSDVTVPDVHRLLRDMQARGGNPARLADRLYAHLDAGRLRVVPDFFWNTADRLWELPPRLRFAFRGASLVLMKGDFNYRRATNDAIWPPGASLAEAVRTFPAPLLMLRTLKSDTLVGVGPDLVEHLDATAGPNWRTNGTYGVIQFATWDEPEPIHRA